MNSRFWLEKVVRFRKDSRILIADFVTFLERNLSTKMRLLVLPIVGLLLALWYHLSFNQTEAPILLVFQILSLTLFFSGLLYLLVSYLTGKKIRWPKTILMVSFVSFTAYWLPQGFDLTDEGRRILTAWYVTGGYLNHMMPMRIGTNLSASLWLHLLPEPSILWSRMGHLAVVSGMVYTSYRILREYFTTNFLLPAVLMSGLVFTTHLVYTVNYNVLPSLYLLVGIYFLIRKPGQRLSTAFVRYSISSFFFTLAILSNFTLAIFIPIFLIEAGIRLFSKERQKLVPGLIGFFIGTASVLVLVWLTLISLNIDGLFWLRLGAVQENNLTMAVNAGNATYSHSIGRLFEIYSAQWIQIIPKTLIGSAIIGFWIYVSIRTKRYYRFFTHVIIAIVALDQMNRMEMWWEALLVAFNSLLIVSLFLKLKWRKYSSLILWALALYFGTYLGSNNGLVNVFFSGGSLLIIPVLLLLIKDKMYKTKRRYKGLRFLTLSSFFILLIFTLYKHRDLVYREAPRAELSTFFNTSQLNGICSTPERVQEIDAYCAFLEANISEEARILHVNKVPSLALLSKRAYLEHWKWAKWNQTEESLRSEEGPEYILINHKDPRSPLWPKSTTEGIAADMDSYNFHVVLVSQSYEEVYRTEALSLHRRLSSLSED